MSAAALALRDEDALRRSVRDALREHDRHAGLSGNAAMHDRHDRHDMQTKHEQYEQDPMNPILDAHRSQAQQNRNRTMHLMPEALARAHISDQLRRMSLRARRALASALMQ